MGVPMTLHHTLVHRLSLISLPHLHSICRIHAAYPPVKHPGPPLTYYTPPSNQDEIDNVRPTSLPGNLRYDAFSAPTNPAGSSSFSCPAH
ncbi:uncharacterized protein LY79DRAFT_44570 [Colletotrichum navitas]|uniref:Uncharacterized protein n=1 Tax=Colletotrichum navitas TaxID=681940 RepID=A0AAD8UZY9_9PEZI|nr:uncharacterized protein LY79DRAFT_44570 [Colletotrichum navitas]KAK1572671.1 hypothetical protein LY79DRAFT_44570 [Colletotrichum navitas]